MNKQITSFVFACPMFLYSCGGSDDLVTTAVGITNKVKGKVQTITGSPIANAKITVENTVFLASYVHATSNNNGEYKVEVPNGSWNATAQIERNFEGRTYTFDLHPDIAQPFTGTAGAVRNFTWKLNGVKPGGGYYGSQVAVYPDILSGVTEQDVELTLTPVGSLIDGTAGNIITRTLMDIGAGEAGVRDIPIGKYRITARHLTTGQPLQIRLRNNGTFDNAVTAMFTSGFTGSTTYQIVTEVKL